MRRDRRAPQDTPSKRPVRVDICNRAAGFCEYCSAYVGMTGTIDHFWPLSRGGSWKYSNLRWACLACNTLKADMAPHEWYARRAALAFIGPPRETKAQARRRLRVEIALRALAAQRIRNPLAGTAGSVGSVSESSSCFLSLVNPALHVGKQSLGGVG